MLQLPRLALGTFQTSSESRFVAWALEDLLASQGQEVQHFFYRACYQPIDGAVTATGLSSRQLDTWLMPRSRCRELFVRSAIVGTLALVEGVYDMASPLESDTALGGSLDTLCQWLDLPRVVIVDVSQLDPHNLPSPPPRTDALILDQVIDHRHLSHWRTQLETLWGVPVVAALEQLTALREEVARLPLGSMLPRELCEALGEALSSHADCEKIMALARQRPFEAQDIPPTEHLRGDAPHTERFTFGNSFETSPAEVTEPAFELPGLLTASNRVTIAVAYDEAFHCYCSDAFEELEALGAKVVDFSPLHDESLPPQTDLLYIGCGFPERHAEALSANHCMFAALREHVCAGRRVFAEGGGLAYLCQYLQSPEGEFFPMAGILPARAHLADLFLPPRPIEVTLSDNTWLGPALSPLRGYLGSRWRLEVAGHLQRLCRESEHELDFVGIYQVLASRIHLNFPAQGELLRHLVSPVAVTPAARQVPLA